MNRDDLIGTFSRVVGVSKAEDIVADAEAALGFDRRERYSHTEVRDLCDEVVAAYDGYIAEIADELRVHSEAQQRFDTLLENVPDPAAVVGFDDGVAVVETVNEAFETVFGYERARVRGEPLADLIRRDEGSSGIDAWAASGDATDREVTRVTADGEERTFLLRTAMASTAGGDVEGYAVYTDITERIERERTLDVLTNLFSRVFRHNVRNEMSVVIGHLSDVLARSTDDAVVERSQSALAAAERLLAHTEKARDIERLVAADPGRTDRSLPALVTTALDRDDALLQGVSVRRDVPEVAVRVVDGFEAAVANAVENAVVHSEGAVTVEITADVATETVTLLVDDDGPGIAESETEALRAGTESQLRHGSGVGLWLMGWYVEKSGGDLTVAGHEEGTTVRMVLDRA